MNKPSKEWQQATHATLDRARRQLDRAMNPITTAFIASCTVYLGGLINLLFFPKLKPAYTEFEILQILVTAASGVLLSLLISALFVLEYVTKRLETLSQDYEP